MNRHHSDFISYYFSFFYNGGSYLELGLYEGETVNKIKQHTSDITGVDIIDRKIPDITFVNKATDVFFSENIRKFNVIFIDADHSYKSVEKDFDNSLKCLSVGGSIY